MSDPLSRDSPSSRTSSRPRVERRLFPVALWQATSKAAALTAPVERGVGHTSRTVRQKPLTAHQAFERQVAFAHLVTMLDGALSDSTGELRAALIEAGLSAGGLGHDSPEAEDLLKEIPANWGAPENRFLYSLHILQLHRAHLLPALPLSPLLNTQAGRSVHWAFKDLVKEALIDAWARGLYLTDRMASFDQDVLLSNITELVGIDLMHKLAEGTPFEMRPSADGLAVADLIAFLDALVGEASGVEPHEGLRRSVPRERARLLVEAERRGFRAGVAWWIAAKKMPTGEAQSLFGFTHVSSKSLNLQQWQPRYPRLPCYVADSDLRYAVCAAAADHLTEEGHEAIAYHRYD